MAGVNKVSSFTSKGVRSLLSQELRIPGRKDVTLDEGLAHHLLWGENINNHPKILNEHKQAIRLYIPCVYKYIKNYIYDLYVNQIYTIYITSECF